MAKQHRLMHPCLWFLLSCSFLFSAVAQDTSKIPSQISPETVLKRAKIKSEKRPLEIIIRDVDIRHFPEIGVIVEAFDRKGHPVDTLRPSDLRIFENGIEKLILRVERVKIDRKKPVDFVFVLDVTGTMGTYIQAIRNHLRRFTEVLQRRGIDYRLSLVLFTDVVEKTYPFTSNVDTFLGYLRNLRAEGGLDEKENALEALAAAIHLPFRESAERVVILITDAPYHQKGEFGAGVTQFTTQTIVDLLKRKRVRVFCITQPKLKEYHIIAKATQGAIFDIEQPFFDILNRFSRQLTTLFAVYYRTDKEIPPDSIEIGIYDRRSKKLIKKKISIIEIGRRLIIENLLFESGSAALPDTVPELDRIAIFMKRHPRVKIRVEGHTDSRGSARFNQRLSIKRAEAVKRYLVAKGVAPSRILVYGYGESQPIASNATEFGRRLNRRTEIVIIDK